MSKPAACVDLREHGFEEVRVSATATELSAAVTAIFARAEAMMLIVDAEQHVVAINASTASALGVADPNSLVGRDATALVAVRDAPGFRRALREAARGGASTQEHTLASFGEGTPRSVAWSIARVSETPCLVACVGVDVTLPATRSRTCAFAR
jgi:hypothetical protein